MYRVVPASTYYKSRFQMSVPVRLGHVPQVRRWVWAKSIARGSSSESNPPTTRTPTPRWSGLRSCFIARRLEGGRVRLGGDSESGHSPRWRCCTRPSRPPSCSFLLQRLVPPLCSCSGWRPSMSQRRNWPGRRRWWARGYCTCGRRTAGCGNGSAEYAGRPTVARAGRLDDRHGSPGHHDDGAGGCVRLAGAGEGVRACDPAAASL
jgi:hypothetical protein